MIVDERIVSYINSLNKENDDLLNSIEARAIKDFVPIIKKETQNLLKVLLTIKQPESILEIGTAVGFSALLMSCYAPGHITTIEKYEKRIPIAKENFLKAGKDNRITLLEGDALEILKSLKDSYDFIFMDASKAQYIHFLPDILRVLKAGGILVSDNVLQDGDIKESRFAVTRRNRTIHSRMREYLYEIQNHKELVSTILPVGDGVTVSTKNISL